MSGSAGVGSLLDVLHDGTSLSADYIVQLMTAVQRSLQLDMHRGDWRLILTRVEEFASGAENWALLAMFYVVLCRESALQDRVLASIREPARREFYAQHWLPYLVAMTETLRVYCFTHANADLMRYSDSLREAWLLQCVLPTSESGLENITPITLIRSTTERLHD